MLTNYNRQILIELNILISSKHTMPKDKYIKKLKKLKKKVRKSVIAFIEQTESEQSIMNQVNKILNQDNNKNILRLVFIHFFIDFAYNINAIHDFLLVH